MDPQTAVKRTVDEVESLTGCPVQVVQDSSVKNMAVLDVARGPVRLHRIRIHPNFAQEAAYLTCFKCGFILRKFGVAPRERFDVSPASTDSVLHNLLTGAGCTAGTTLDDWLRNQFFDQHCKRFHNRPFIWHIWDGRKDRFSALVNYHKLDHKALGNLIYSYLGDWITAQSKSDKVGADLRLNAAQELQQKLKLILAGEPPHDIFVRWKPLHEQPIGGSPNLNDGVRINIRPFMTAGILRKNPNIKWTKDRGKEPERDINDYPWFWKDGAFTGDRVNDIHLTNAVKMASRRAKGATP